MGRGKRPQRASAGTIAATVATTDGRPLLLIDIDGVLLCDRGERCELASGGVVHVALGAARLKEIVEHYDSAWATEWGERANEEIAPLLGLPELPLVPFFDAFKLGDRRGRSSPRGRGKRGHGFSFSYWGI